VIREFETGLADALGARLPAPLAGAVDAAPGRNSARMVVSVRSAEPVEDDLLSVRPEQVPGSPDARRVLKLRCEVGLEVRQPPSGTRVDQLAAIDQTIYLLGEAGFADGTVLLPGSGDPGFLIRQLRLVRADVPATIVLQADGFFWPVGLAGETGPAIVSTRIRQAIGPIRIAPERPALVAGGAPVELSIEIDTMGAMGVEAGGEVQGFPFGAVLVRVVDAGGRPGEGVLGGGSPGPGDSRIVTVADGAARIEYTPPAEPVTELLVVALERPEGGAGVELGRFPLRVRAAS
jgi:hypothetical protein